MLARSSVGLILVLFATAVPVRAQDTLLHLRELYASAAYDEALTMVGRLATGRSTRRPSNIACSVSSRSASPRRPNAPRKP